MTDTAPAPAVLNRPEVAAVVSILVGVSAEPEQLRESLTRNLDGLTVAEVETIAKWLESLPAGTDATVIERTVESEQGPPLRGITDVPEPLVSGDPDLLGTIHIDKTHPDQVRVGLGHPPADPDTYRRALLKKLEGDRIEGDRIP